MASLFFDIRRKSVKKNEYLNCILPEGEVIDTIVPVSETEAEFYIRTNRKKGKSMIESNLNHEKAVQHGYIWNGMYIMKGDAALELYKKGFDVYKLYEDNTEALVESADDLLNFAQEDGLFGVEKNSTAGEFYEKQA